MIMQKLSSTNSLSSAMDELSARHQQISALKRKLDSADETSNSNSEAIYHSPKSFSSIHDISFVKNNTSQSPMKKRKVETNEISKNLTSNESNPTKTQMLNMNVQKLGLVDQVKPRNFNQVNLLQRSKSWTPDLLDDVEQYVLTDMVMCQLVENNGGLINPLQNMDELIDDVRNAFSKTTVNDPAIPIKFASGPVEPLTNAEVSVLKYFLA